MKLTLKINYKKFDMSENLDNLKLIAEKEFPYFTGRIVLDMYEGEVGSTEKTAKKRYALKKPQKTSIPSSGD